MTDPQPDLWTPDLVLTAKGAPFAPIVSTGAIRLLTPDERSRRHGLDGAEDGAKHLKDEAPAFVLESLGNALLAFRASAGFTSEDVRLRAEQSAAVKGWLDGPTRNACFSGWFRSRIRLHRLERVICAPRIAQRASRRGATLPVWKFPS